MAASKIAIDGAIAANTAIATTKFVVAGITGGSAMLSEGIHSVRRAFKCKGLGRDVLVNVPFSYSPRD